MRRHLDRAEHAHQQADRAERAGLERLLRADRQAEREHASERPPTASCRERTGSRFGRRSFHASTSSRIAISQRLIAVAIALPATPSAGLPRCPYTNTQLSARWPAFATTIVHTIGATRCMAWRLCRRTTNARKAATPAIEMRSIRRGVGDDLRRLMQHAEHRRRRRDRAPQRRIDSASAMASPRCMRARHGVRVVRADRLRDERVERHQRAGAEERHVEEVQIPERDRGEHRRRQSSDHERVHHAHRHEAELHEHDGNRERHGRPQLRSSRLDR